MLPCSSSSRGFRASTRPGAIQYAVLLRAKGAGTQATDVHDAWSAWMIGVDPGHESIRPFDDLDPETRREDSPFLLAIRAAAARS